MRCEPASRNLVDYKYRWRLWSLSCTAGTRNADGRDGVITRSSLTDCGETVAMQRMHQLSLSEAVAALSTPEAFIETHRCLPLVTRHDTDVISKLVVGNDCPPTSHSLPVIHPNIAGHDARSS